MVRANLYVLCLSTILASTVTAALSTPDQFAYQAVVTESTQALQRVELPVEILLAATRADLGDVVVFDASGKSLPSWIRKAVIAESQVRYELPIYLFNTYQQNRSKTITTREQNQDQGALSESTTTETVPIDEALQDYIIGLPETNLDLEIQSIELKWAHEPADQLLRLRVDVGNDLDNWRTIQGNKSLTNQNSENAEWRTIGAIPAGEKYLRLTPINSIRSFEITRAIGTYHQKAGERKIWHQLGELQKTPGQPGYFSFEMPSPVPVLELKLIPGEQQSLISGVLHASQQGFNQNRLIDSNIQQHNFTGSEIEPNKPIKLPVQHYVNWWFKPNQQPDSAPWAEIAFPVYELIFLGNDNIPYTLAWGNHESDAPANELINLLSTDQQKQPPSQLVQLGSRQIAGGESRLSPQAKLPWLKWLLWLLLAGALVTTGKMAASLIRDMKAA